MVADFSAIYTPMMSLQVPLKMYSARAFMYFPIVSVMHWQTILFSPKIFFLQFLMAKQVLGLVHMYRCYCCYCENANTGVQANTNKITRSGSKIYTSPLTIQTWLDQSNFSATSRYFRFEYLRFIIKIVSCCYNYAIFCRIQASTADVVVLSLVCCSTE